jgi:hypothetical protein
MTAREAYSEFLKIKDTDEMTVCAYLSQQRHGVFLSAPGPGQKSRVLVLRIDTRSLN